MTTSEFSCDPSDLSDALSVNDIRSFLAGYGISPRELAVTPLEGGGGNLVLLLEADGRKLVLRRYERVSPEEAGFELQLIRVLTERGFPVQPLLARTDGSLAAPLPERPAALFEYVVGQEPVPGSRETAMRLAETLARLHVVTRDMEISDSRACTDAAALSRLEESVRSDGERVTDPLWPQLRDDCRELRRVLDERLLPHASQLPKGIIHHDLHPGNLLLDPNGQIVLLDFDEAQLGWFVLDIASLIRYWAMDGEWAHADWARVDELLSVYDRHRPLLDIERDLLPEAMLLFFMGDALGFILPALARDPASSAVTECHAYRRFRDLRADLAKDGTA